MQGSENRFRNPVFTPTISRSGNRTMEYPHPPTPNGLNERIMSEKKSRKYKSVDALVKGITGITFQKYWRELRRHDRELFKIFASDPSHICKPEKTGSFGQVYPKQKTIAVFYRCSVCHKDLPTKPITRQNEGG